MPSFEDWWERSGQHYERAVIEAGGRHRAECPACLEGQACSRVPTPWPLDPEKRAANAKRLGLPEDTDPMELRRALWERRNKRNAA